MRKLKLCLLLSAILFLLVGCPEWFEKPDDDLPAPPPFVYTVTGKVVDAHGDGIEGVTLHFSEGFGAVATDEDGIWIKTDLEGTVEITPAFIDNGKPYEFVPKKTIVDKETEADFTGYPQSPMGEEIDFETGKPLAFEGGVIIDPAEEDIPEGTKVFVEEVLGSENLPFGFEQAGKIVRITFNYSLDLAEGIKLRIPAHDGIVIPHSDIYHYDETDMRWVRQSASFEHGGFVCSVRDFSIFGVLTDTSAYITDLDKVNQLLEAAAAKYDLPPVLLKAIAFQESGWNHYWQEGELIELNTHVKYWYEREYFIQPGDDTIGRVKVRYEPPGDSFKNGAWGIGIMQKTIDLNAPYGIPVNQAESEFLMEDIANNIEAGAQYLRDQWGGGSNPDGWPVDNRYLIENWWYATVKYNGLTMRGMEYADKKIREIVRNPPNRILRFMEPLGWTSPFEANKDFQFTDDLKEYFSAQFYPNNPDGKQGGFYFANAEGHPEFVPAPVHFWKLHYVEHHKLTIQVEGDGTVDPEEGIHTFDKDTSVPLRATPADEWLFDKWIGEVADTTSAETTVLIDKDKTVTAVFTRPG